ncbi:transposable element Tcb1 transposase [Trichonephila clavipes]|nr:transposable element Tcb1 transposase [Trichonephila clavipes]
MFFQLDNAPCQKSKIVLEWFQEHDAEFQLMSWSPNSSDINPIEYIWDVMGRQLRVQRPPIRNISDLWDRCLNIWYNLSPAIYQGDLWHPCQGGLKLCCTPKLEVSQELGITQSVITRLWQPFQADGNVSRCYSTGHPRVTTPNEDRYLAVTAKRNRRSTVSDQSRQLSSATGTTVSRQTVYRRLGHIGLYARRPARCVPLTATHCRL